MTGDGIQNYVNLAAGLTRATREKARTAARGLLASAHLDDVAADAGDRVGKLAEEVLAASRANRELLVNLVVAEVDKAAGRLGFARRDDLDALQQEVSELRLSLAEQAARAETAATVEDDLLAAVAEPVVVSEPPSPETATPAATGAPAAKKASPTKKTPAKKAAAKKTPTKTSAAEATAESRAAESPAPTDSSSFVPPPPPA